jgi:hypothetical protein
MTDRITKAQLERLCERINWLHQVPNEALDPQTGRANVGTFTLSGAYGGWKLEKITNEAGGCVDVLSIGYASKRALYDAMHAYLTGLQDGLSMA